MSQEPPSSLFEVGSLSGLELTCWAPGVALFPPPPCWGYKHAPHVTFYRGSGASFSGLDACMSNISPSELSPLAHRKPFENDFLSPKTSLNYQLLS